MTKAKLGEVEIDVITSESVTRNSNITSRPTEKEDVTDHIYNEPIYVNISGISVPPKGGWSVLQKLLKYRKEKKLLKYIHRNSVSNVVIESFDTDHGYDVDKGFKFSMTLKHIKIVNAVEIPNESLQDTQTSNISNMGSQPVRSK